MDFDLFELDVDDDLLSSVYIEATQRQSEDCTDDVIPELQCCGEDSWHIPFSAEGFIKTAFLTADTTMKTRIYEEVCLTAYEFNAQHLQGRAVANFLFAEACKNIQYLSASVYGAVGSHDELSFYQRRLQVTQLLHLLLRTTQPEQWSLVRSKLTNIRRLLNHVTGPDAWKMVYFANSTKGNECNVASYHFLHGALEWKFLDLCLLLKFELDDAGEQEKHATPAATIFVHQIEILFDDLLICTGQLFRKKKTTELMFSSPFPCTCFREIWLLLQLAVKKWATNAAFAAHNLNFWELFNGAVLRLQNKMDFSSLNHSELSNWLLNALTRLHGYRSNGEYVGSSSNRANTEDAENFELCENITQKFLDANPSEEKLRIFMCQLMPTLLEWWRPKVNIPMMLWEHFHKRLNTSFYVAGAAPSNLAVACASGKSYLEKYRALLTKQQADANLTSYTLFTLLLGKTLERLLKEKLHNQSQKLLGRIYAKFSLPKFLALNETGIHHLTELFLVLALSGDFEDLGPKLRDKLLSIAFDKVTPSRQTVVAKAHMALLLLFVERRCDVADYVSKLLNQLHGIRNDLAVSKVFADGLLDVYSAAEHFCHGEHLLIDSWLPNYLHSCTPTEQARALEALHLIFSKMRHSELFLEANASLMQRLNTHILPFLKQQYTTDFSPWFPKLAADFCLQATDFQKLFNYFLETQTANRQALPQFLLLILQSEKAHFVNSASVIQVWLKSLVILTNVNEEVANLTKLVVELSELHLLMEFSAVDILTAKEPLCVFISAVGKSYDACTDYQRRCRIADNMNAYLRNFEKWLLPDTRQEKTEVLFRYYSFLAIVIYNCPHIVYAKSKITCFFHIAMTRFVLPTSIQMGKPPDGKLAQLIHKVWPVLVQGIGRLNFKSDPYVNKMLTDVIQKWTPHFKISPNSKLVARPFISCLHGDNYELSLFVCEKLTNLFLNTQRRQADPNACLVITIFQEVVESFVADTVAEVTTTERRLETFMKAASLVMLEHIMMVDEVVPSRTLLLDLLTRLINSKVFQQNRHLGQLLAEHLRILTKKHLAYYTFFYFELLMKITQISPTLVEGIMDFLVSEIHVVEEKRGGGEDNRIRGCLQKLCQSIESSKLKEMESIRGQAKK